MIRSAALLCFGVFTFSVNVQAKGDINSRIKKVDNNTYLLRLKVHSDKGINSNQPVTISEHAGQSQIVHDNLFYQKDLSKIVHINSDSI